MPYFPDEEHWDRRSSHTDTDASLADESLEAGFRTAKFGVYVQNKYDNVDRSLKCEVLFSDKTSIDEISQVFEGETEVKSFQNTMVCPYGGGGSAADFLLDTYVTDLFIKFGASGAILGFLRFSVNKFLEWKKISQGNTVKIKVGDTMIEVKGAVDIEKAVEAAEKLSKLEPTPQASRVKKSNSTRRKRPKDNVSFSRGTLDQSS
jgi:hypothetical protein